MRNQTISGHAPIGRKQTQKENQKQEHAPIQKNTSREENPQQTHAPIHKPMPNEKPPLLTGPKRSKAEAITPIFVLIFKLRTPGQDNSEQDVSVEVDERSAWFDLEVVANIDWDTWRLAEAKILIDCQTIPERVTLCCGEKVLSHTRALSLQELANVAFPDMKGKGVDDNHSSKISVEVKTGFFAAIASALHESKPFPVDKEALGLHLPAVAGTTTITARIECVVKRITDPDAIHRDVGFTLTVAPD